MYALEYTSFELLSTHTGMFDELQRAERVTHFTYLFGEIEQNNWINSM